MHRQCQPDHWHWPYNVWMTVRPRAKKTPPKRSQPKPTLSSSMHNARTLQMHGRTREAVFLCFLLAVGVALAIGARHDA